MKYDKLSKSAQIALQRMPLVPLAAERIKKDFDFSDKLERDLERYEERLYQIANTPSRTGKSYKTQRNTLKASMTNILKQLQNGYK